MKIFGYMRISTNGDKQKTDRQKLALNEYAKENNFTFSDIVEEKISGTVKTDNRQEYSLLKKILRENDILIVSDLDRLGRNADNIIKELKELKEMKVKVIALDMPYMNEFNRAIDNDMYNMIIDIVIAIKAHMAEQERKKIVSRINQGLAVAKEQGKTLGRPKATLPDNFIKEYDKFKSGKYGKISALQFAKMLGIGRATLYKYISIYNEQE